MVPPQGQVIIIQNAAEIRAAHSHHKHSALKSTAQSSHGRPARQISFAPEMVETREGEYQGLVFHVDNGDAVQDDAMEALTAIAQVNTSSAHAKDVSGPLGAPLSGSLSLLSLISFFSGLGCAVMYSKPALLHAVRDSWCSRPATSHLIKLESKQAHFHVVRDPN